MTLHRTHRRLLLALVLAAACSRDDGERIPLGGADTGTAAGAATLSPAARASLEEGNVAFRAKRYDDALAAYRRAASQSPNDVAPLWGIQMAARAMNDAALADSAVARMRELSPEAAPAAGQDPHASPVPAAGGALPANHPPVGTPRTTPQGTPGSGSPR